MAKQKKIKLPTYLSRGLQENNQQVIIVSGNRLKESLQFASFYLTNLSLHWYLELLFY